jgi:ABC-type multidrug transport system fused ATPase/permease subunit
MTTYTQEQLDAAVDAVRSHHAAEFRSRFDVKQALGCSSQLIPAQASEIALSESGLHVTGLHTPAGKNGSALSGGQRQAVWLMRTFMREPRVQLLLLDEPTAAMDPESRVAVAHAIRLFGATTVVVTHDEQLARDIEATRLIDFAKM